MPFLLAKFAFFSLAAKFSDVNLLNSGVVIYLSWLWLVIFFSISLIFVLYSVFLPKLVTLGILFSTALRAVLVDKLVISDVLSSTFFILTLYTYFYIHLYIIHL